MAIAELREGDVIRLTEKDAPERKVVYVQRDLKGRIWKVHTVGVSTGRRSTISYRNLHNYSLVRHENE